MEKKLTEAEAKIQIEYWSAPVAITLTRSEWQQISVRLMLDSMDKRFKKNRRDSLSKLQHSIFDVYTQRKEGEYDPLKDQD
tara:strand:- start:62 stop:304 length:243 start_codon:yes stop_codon:yes gene_type:complete